MLEEGLIVPVIEDVVGQHPYMTQLVRGTLA